MCYIGHRGFKKDNFNGQTGTFDKPWQFSRQDLLEELEIIKDQESNLEVRKGSVESITNAVVEGFLCLTCITGHV